jgi:uncharacterized membrane protein YiaA
MEANKGKNNFITHAIGLYKAAYDLSRDGYQVKIDTSASKSGHIKIQKDGKDFYVMIKALTDLVPVPFASDYEITEKFDHLLICVGVYNELISYYKLDMQYARSKIIQNINKNGEVNHWMNVPEYEEFKVNSLIFP